jgi:hypothetical protein
LGFRPQLIAPKIEVDSINLGAPFFLQLLLDGVSFGCV